MSRMFPFERCQVETPDTILIKNRNNEYKMLNVEFYLFILHS